LKAEEINISAEPAGKIRVGITYNLKKNKVTEPPDAEAEFDELGTILAIKSALEPTGCAVELFEAEEDLPVRLLQSRPDIVFNIAECARGRGREAQVPAILNYLGIPFTGSDETTMCVAINKALTKRLVGAYNIRTPKFKVFGQTDRISARGLAYPVIVKPNSEGSSKGISGQSIVSEAGDLRRALTTGIEAYGLEMLVEEYIRGREFTVGILGNGNGIRVFPPMEIRFKDEAHSVYSYEVKRNFKKYVDYICPPDIPPELMNEVTSTAGRIYRILECRDCARVDFRLGADGRLYFIEINPLPGLAPGYRDFPILAEFSGVGYAELIRSILDHALDRYKKIL